MIYDICSIADAMSWLACTHEMENKEAVTRASESRERIYKRLLEDNKEIAQHFYDISLAVLNSVENNF